MLRTHPGLLASSEWLSRCPRDRSNFQAPEVADPAASTQARNVFHSCLFYSQGMSMALSLAGRPTLSSRSTMLCQQSPGSQTAALTPVGLECVRAEQQEGCTAGSGQVTGICHLLKVNKKSLSHFPLFGYKVLHSFLSCLRIREGTYSTK